METEQVTEEDLSVCISCGAKAHKGAEVCSACGRPMREVIRDNIPEDLPPEECVHWSDKPASAGRTAKISVAGILVLMAGFLGISQALISLAPEISEGFIRTLEEVVPGMETVDNLMADYLLLQAAFFVFGVVAVFGSMYALMGSRFDMAVIGAVFGIPAFGFMIGALFSVFGLIMIVTSRKEFLSECG